MQLQKSLSINTIKKDTVKGQKIIAATYLITRHLSDTDALKDKIRSTAQTFVCLEGREQENAYLDLQMLIGGAVLAGVINEKNASILLYEIKLFFQNAQVIHRGQEGGLEDFFATGATFSGSHHFETEQRKQSFDKGHLKRQEQQLPHYQSHLKDNKPAVVIKDKNVAKLSRQETILKFINERKSAVIKDIVALFPEVSEKTIQRELNALIDTGRITKRGSKRWSIYMAVSSLL